MTKNNALGVSLSWNNAETRIARSTRSSVIVAGTEYRSTAAAFAALFPNASIAAHQKFRKALVQDGSRIDSEGRLWVAKTTRNGQPVIAPVIEQPAEAQDATEEQAAAIVAGIIALTGEHIEQPAEEQAEEPKQRRTRK
jgi:hypothetical protein